MAASRIAWRRCGSRGRPRVGAGVADICFTILYRKAGAKALAHGIDRRQALGGAEPRRAGVAGAEDLARGGAEVELEGRALAAAGEGLAQDRQEGVLLRQAVATRRPVRTGVARLVDADAAVGGDAVGVGVQRDDVGAVGI